MVITYDQITIEINWLTSPFLLLTRIIVENVQGRNLNQAYVGWQKKPFFIVLLLLCFRLKYIIVAIAFSLTSLQLCVLSISSSLSAAFWSLGLLLIQRCKATHTDKWFYSWSPRFTFSASTGSFWYLKFTCQRLAKARKGPATSRPLVSACACSANWLFRDAGGPCGVSVHLLKKLYTN